MRLRRQAEYRRCLHDILDGGAKAREQMVVVGIDDRRPSREIGNEGDGGLPDNEAPRLRIVTVRSERGAADKLVKRRAPRQTGRKRAPDRRDGVAPGVNVLPRPQGNAANAGRYTDADRSRTAYQNCPAIHAALPGANFPES